MNNLLIKTILSLFGFWVLISQAEIEPKATKYDKRTRIVYYNPYQVYRIKAYAGFGVMIIFGEDEFYQAHALGDPAAWEFASTGRFVFLKPRQEQASTNLFVLTNKHYYTFNLLAHSGKIFKSKEVEHFSIKFRYPQEQAKRRELAKNNKKIEQSLSVSKNLRFNMKYKSCGDRSISPIAVYDNGVQTYMKFASNSDIPAVYYLNSRKKENLINYNVHNDWISVHRVAKEFILRRGDEVACLINNNNKSSWRRPASGTISSKVKREVRDEK